MIYKIYALGDSAITVELGNTIDIATHEKVMTVYNLALKNPIVGVRDIIPAYCTVTWVYDIVGLRKNYPITSAYKFMQTEIEKIYNQLESQNDQTNRLTDQPTNRLITIPVHYYTDGSFDLQNLAQQRAMSVETFISIHTNTTYRVYLLGFLPGFAYMGSVDERIAAPRLAQPRTIIPAGCVGIAGEQTGIYPVASPGGWNIIGRTDVKLFDPEKENPILLKVGDSIKFVDSLRD